jgi:hypothetical protein
MMIDGLPATLAGAVFVFQEVRVSEAVKHRQKTVDLFGLEPVWA